MKRQTDRLGLAVQLCTLPWLAFVPDEVSAAPPVAVARLAERLGLDAAALEGYGHRAHTRSDHLRLVADYLGWKSAPADSVAMKDLDRLLMYDVGLGMTRLAWLIKPAPDATALSSSGRWRARVEIFSWKIRVTPAPG
jgi:hypothetical protein